MTSFGQLYVVPAVGRSQQRYPEAQIKLTLAQNLPDSGLVSQQDSVTVLRLVIRL